jgi:LuxR family maltose regulon positive regulatory protein
VSAPAGFGKTTLLTEWFGSSTEQESSTAWLSLDGRDNDPALFWSYVVAALQTVAPQVGATSLSLLRSAPSAMEPVVATLLNDLDAVTDDVALVLDDYHVIESPDLHQAMAYMVEHLPPHVRLVLASRADPPLPLARLRARGELLEIRAADLRFTTDEAATYLHDAMGLALTRADVGALEARTEGWIAALQLAALSMQGRDDIPDFIAGFAGDDRFVVDYLVGEVLERQSEEVRSFLLQTAVLDRLSGPLCDAVTGGNDGKAMLERLDRANLFLVPLDDRRAWYRYHHLFADVLRARQLDEEPGHVHELHRRAGAWYEAHGDRAEAISHALAGADFAKAAELVELAGPAMRQARQEATLRRWLEALPDELFPDRPVLTVGLIGARMATGDVNGVEPLLRSVEQWIDAPRPTAIVFDEAELARLPAQVSVYRAGLALLAGDIAGTIAHADRALDLMESTDHLGRGAAAALTGLAHWAVGELEPARSRYAAAVTSFVAAGFIPDVLGVSLGLADIQLAQGRLGDAMRTFESALDHTDGQPLRGTADMHIGLSEVLLERNELDDAIRHLEASGALGEHAGLPQHAYRWRVATARIRLAQGDGAGALELLHDAARVYNTDFSPAVRPIPALVARVHLALGDVAAALRWAADRGVTADDQLDYVQEFEHITLARGLLADGSLDDALQLLDRLLAAAEAGQREGSVIEVLILESLAHQAGGDVPAALAALEQALVRAEPEGWVRVFVDEGPPMAALLRTVSSPLAPRILAAFGGGPSPTPARSGLVDELSSRERDVLRLLRSDLSGPDIARELTVSLNTMRTHTKSIYAKLGVSSRREAVRRAAELGL